jgi:hypothetical protein
MANPEGTEDQFLATIGPGSSERTDDVIAGNVWAPTCGHRTENLGSLLSRSAKATDGQNAFPAGSRGNSCLQRLVCSTNGKDHIG